MNRPKTVSSRSPEPAPLHECRPVVSHTPATTFGKSPAAAISENRSGVNRGGAWSVSIGCQWAIRAHSGHGVLSTPFKSYPHPGQCRMRRRSRLVTTVCGFPSINWRMRSARIIAITAVTTPAGNRVIDRRNWITTIPAPEPLGPGALIESGIAPACASASDHRRESSKTSARPVAVSSRNHSPESNSPEAIPKPMRDRETPESPEPMCTVAPLRSITTPVEKSRRRNAYPFARGVLQTVSMHQPATITVTPINASGSTDERSKRNVGGRMVIPWQRNGSRHRRTKWLSPRFAPVHASVKSVSESARSEPLSIRAQRNIVGQVSPALWGRGIGREDGGLVH